MPTRPTATNTTNSAAASAAGLVTPPRVPKPSLTEAPPLIRVGVVYFPPLVIPPTRGNLMDAFNNAK